MRTSCFYLLVFFATAVTAEIPGEFAGGLTLEYRYFASEGAYQNNSRNQYSVTLNPEYLLSWNNDRSVLSFEPFWRSDSIDDERTHSDIRELSYVTSWENVELRLGVSKVFWGVSESQHLVDVINQTDGIENPNGKHKLGQPMINTTFVMPHGNLDVFILPYFRERTFAGSNGRHRGARVVIADEAEYTHDKKEKHVDYAIRWSGYRGDLDWGLSYFQGTDRDAAFRVDETSGETIPVYGQSKQAGLELQYIYKDLLGKAELRHKESDLIETHFASTIGFEYTFYGMRNGIDIGVLYEWLYDTRHESTPSGMGNASFLGARIALNDTATTRVLAGVIVDHRTTRLSTFRLEASRRINNHLSVDVEINVIAAPPDQSFLDQISKDNHVQVTLEMYF